MFSISSYRRLVCASVFLTSSHLTVFVFFPLSHLELAGQILPIPAALFLPRHNQDLLWLHSSKLLLNVPAAVQSAAEDRRWPTGGLFWINRKSESCISSHASQAPPTMRIRCVNLWLPVQLPAFKILLANTPALFFVLQDHLLVKQWATCENNSDANLALNIFAWR